MNDVDFDDGDDDLSWGFFEGQCQACDCYARVNDLSLCQTCAPKLDRDMIRQRAWDYSALAFGLPVEDREKLRDQVIAGHGQALELIAPPKKSGKSGRSKTRR